MKTLLLMRHCEASTSLSARLSDQRLALTLQGGEDAQRVGDSLLRRGTIPQVITCSTALRAASTATIMARALGLKHPVTAIAALYAAEPERYLEEVQLLPLNVEVALVVGHNPAISRLAQLLRREGTAGSQFIPGGLACLEFANENWLDIRYHSGNFKWYLTPDSAG